MIYHNSKYPHHIIIYFSGLKHTYRLTLCNLWQITVMPFVLKGKAKNFQSIGKG